MTNKKKIIIFLVVMCLLLVSVFMRVRLLDFALSPVAKIYNDKQLEEMKKEILKDLDLDEKHIQEVKTSISGEEYFMIGNTPVNERLASCKYYVQLKFSDNNGLSDEELYVLANNFKENNRKNLKIGYRLGNEYHNGWMSFSKDLSIPLGNHGYTIRTKYHGSAGVLVPENVFYPLPLYDSRCRTTILYNGA